MKPQSKTAIALYGILLLIIACTENRPKEETGPITKVAAPSTNSIEGSWELIWESVGGVTRSNGKNSQFKMFHDGFFSLIALDSSGKWSWNGAGTYTLTGNTYKEIFKYSSVPEFVGATDWQKYELKDDTLITEGFIKVVFEDGQDKTSDFPQFIEKRVRAKR